MGLLFYWEMSCAEQMGIKGRLMTAHCATVGGGGGMIVCLRRQVQKETGWPVMACFPWVPRLPAGLTSLSVDVCCLPLGPVVMRWAG